MAGRLKPLTAFKNLRISVGNLDVESRGTGGPSLFNNASDDRGGPAIKSERVDRLLDSRSALRSDLPRRPKTQPCP
jgi:hypothetical protein